MRNAASVETSLDVSIFNWRTLKRGSASVKRDQSQVEADGETSSTEYQISTVVQRKQASELDHVP